MTINGANSLEHQHVFSRIHQTRQWGAGSGPGSTLEYTRRYRAFVEQFVVEHSIRSVLDAGCGDWSFSRAIDWKGADYIGVEIVPELVEQNRARYPNVRFDKGDARDLSAYAGRDLLIVKDVLQHWSRATVIEFLRQPALSTFKHVLLTNCDYGSDEHPDITTGDFRPLSAESPELRDWDWATALEFGTKRVLHRGPRLTAQDVLERFECWVVNLDRRVDRLARTRATLEQLGLGRARRFQAFDGSRLRLTSFRHDRVTKGAVGCYLSHLALLKQAQARRAPCIIVEDDIVAALNFKAGIEDFFAAVPEDWDVISFPGRGHWREPIQLGPHHARLVATWGTTMTILRLHAIDQLLEEADSLEWPIDDYYIQMMPTMKFYTSVQQLVWQDDGLGSDIGRGT